MVETATKKTMQQTKITNLKPNDHILVQMGNYYHEILFNRLEAFTTPENKTYYYLYGTYAGTSMQYIQSFYGETEVPNVITDSLKKTPDQANTTDQEEKPTIMTKTKLETVDGIPGFIHELENEIPDKPATIDLKDFRKPVDCCIMGNTKYFRQNSKYLTEHLNKGTTDESTILICPGKYAENDYERCVLWKKDKNKDPIALGFIPNKITKKLTGYNYDYEILKINTNYDTVLKRDIVKLRIQFTNIRKKSTAA